MSLRPIVVYSEKGGDSTYVLIWSRSRLRLRIGLEGSEPVNLEGNDRLPLVLSSSNAPQGNADAMSMGQASTADMTGATRLGIQPPHGRGFYAYAPLVHDQNDASSMNVQFIFSEFGPRSVRQSGRRGYRGVGRESDGDLLWPVDGQGAS